MRRGLLLITLAAAFLMLFVLSAEGSDAGIGDQVTYDGMTFEILTDGAVKDVKLVNTETKSGDLTLPDAFEKDTVQYRLTALDFDAFHHCAEVTKIIIGDNLSSIDEGAFRDCIKLYKFDVSLTNASFKSDNAGILLSADGGTLVCHPRGAHSDTVGFFGQRIASYALYEHTYLKILTLDPTPNIKEIGDYALYGCTALDTITGSLQNLDTIGLYAFASTALSSFDVPEKITAIPAGCFCSCSSLETVMFLSYTAVLSLGNNAFNGCMNLTNIASTYTPPVGDKIVYDHTLPQTVKTIGDSTFFCCYELTELNIPSGLLTIGEKAFYNCRSLDVPLFPYTSLSSIGDYAFYQCSSLNSVLLGPGMITLGQSAFYKCTSLTSVEIAYTLTNVGIRAFEGCSALKTLTFGNGLQAISDYMFSECTSLEGINIPDSVKTIGQKAFYKCSSASNLHLSTGVITVGENAFNGCIKVPSVDIPGTMQTVPKGMFEGCTGLSTATLGNGVIKIEANAFKGCTVLKYLTLSDTLTSIGSEAFMDNLTLEEVEFPDGLVTIGNYAFCGCVSMERIMLNDGLETIGDYAFSENTSAYGLYLPSTLMSIGTCAFSKCSSLTEVVVPGAVSTLGTELFRDCTSLTFAFLTLGLTEVSNGMFQGCQNLDKVTLQSGIVTIGVSAFSGCSSLVDITIPDTVTTLGSQVFSDCVSLNMIRIPSLVTEISYRSFDNCLSLTKIEFVTSGSNGAKIIGEYAFSGCESLTDAVLPGTLNEIDNYAFSECESLITVAIPESVTYIGNYSFKGCRNLTSVTVSDSNSTYTSAGGVLFTKDRTGICLYPAGRTASEYAIPDTVVNVNDCAFYQAEYLGSVLLPAGLKTIGDYAFYECTSLGSIIVPSNVTSVGSFAFYGCLLMKSATLGISLQSIGSGAFESCDYLESIYLPDSVSYLGGSAFAYCYSLETVRISPQITSINDDTFLYCTGLRSISLPSGIKTIGNYAFTACTALSDITLPAGLTKIGDYSFSLCLSLKTITIPAGLTDVTSTSFAQCASLENIDVASGSTKFSAFEGVLLSYDKRTLIKYPAAKSNTSYTVPSVVKYIGNTSFLDAVNLTSIKISTGVQTIGNRAFDGCIGITSITIPSTVTSIGSNAFINCTSIASFSVDAGNTAFVSKDDVLLTRDYSALIQYPAAHQRTTYATPDVETILSYAFSSCRNLKSIVIADTVTTINNNAFDGCGSLAQIILPDGLECINDKAFMNCTSITSIIIPEGVVSIGSDVFDGCTSLTAINADSDNATYTSVNGVLMAKSEKGYYTLVRCPEGRTGIYAVPLEVTTIGSGAFRNCILTSVEMKLLVSSIADDAFDGCLNIASYSISLDNNYYCSKNGAIYDKAVTKLLFYPYAATSKYTAPSTLKSFENSSLASIHTIQFVVESGNMLYSANEGVLFDIHRTDLIRYPTLSTGQSYTVPDSVIDIDDGAFEGTQSLRVLTMNSKISVENLVRMTAYVSSITDIVAPEGAYYVASDGMIFDTDMIMLLSVLSTKDEVIMPDTVKRVGELALTGTGANYIKFSANLNNISPFFQYDGTDSKLSFTDHDGKSMVTMPDNLRGQIFAREGNSYRMLILRTISFDVNGGTGTVDSIIADQGTSITLPEISGGKENNAFRGWTDGSKVYQPGDTYVVGTGDVTFTAVWESTDNTSIIIVIAVIGLIAAVGLVYYIRHRHMTKI